MAKYILHVGYKVDPNDPGYQEIKKIVGNEDRLIAEPYVPWLYHADSGYIRRDHDQGEMRSWYSRRESKEFPGIVLKIYSEFENLIKSRYIVLYTIIESKQYWITIKNTTGANPISIKRNLSTYKEKILDPRININLKPYCVTK